MKLKFVKVDNKYYPTDASTGSLVVSVVSNNKANYSLSDFSEMRGYVTPHDGYKAIAYCKKNGYELLPLSYFEKDQKS